MAAGFNDALLDVGGTAMRDAVTHLSLHTAEPNAAGSNESSAARQPVSWSAVSNGGDWSLPSPLSFTGGAAGGPVTHVGLWSASSSGTFYGYFAIGGGSDVTFNAAGEYDLTALAVTGSAG